MRRGIVFLLVLTVLAGACGKSTPPSSGKPQQAKGAPTIAPLLRARLNFSTRLIRRVQSGEPIDEPPPQIFQIVKYEARPGKLAAYLSPDPQDGAQHPAILWIHGGEDYSSIGNCWDRADPRNDQTAAAYRDAGIIMMVPSMRGGNQNPGYAEGFLGEVDDVLAAADYLGKLPYVDPARIYLGGHSTGGTVVLLAAESSAKFRAVFSMGPVEEIAGYAASFDLPFDATDKSETNLRSPIRWLNSVQSPTFAFEGDRAPSNIIPLRLMSTVAAGSSKIHFFAASGVTHFSMVGPLNRLIAEKILADDGPMTTISFSAQELSGLAPPVTPSAPPLALSPATAREINNLAVQARLGSNWYVRVGLGTLDISTIRIDPVNEIRWQSQGINLVANRKEESDVRGIVVNFHDDASGRGFSFDSANRSR